MKPWISPDILQKCKHRDDLLKSTTKETNQAAIDKLRSEYKKIRNEITSDKRESKKLYFDSYFKKNKHKTSKIWKGIRLLVNSKASKSSHIKLLDDQNNLISDPKKIANIFNDHFSTIGSKVDSKIPRVPGSYKSYLTKKDINNNHLLNPANSFFLTPTVPGEITRIIDLLDLNKSTGPMSLSPYLLKTYKEFFSY